MHWTSSAQRNTDVYSTLGTDRHRSRYGGTCLPSHGSPRLPVESVKIFGNCINVPDDEFFCPCTIMGQLLPITSGATATLQSTCLLRSVEVSASALLYVITDVTVLSSRLCNSRRATVSTGCGKTHSTALQFLRNNLAFHSDEIFGDYLKYFFCVNLANFVTFR